MIPPLYPCGREKILAEVYHPESVCCVSVEPRVQSVGKVKTELTDSELCLEFLHVATRLSAEPLDGWTDGQQQLPQSHPAVAKADG